MECYVCKGSMKPNPAKRPGGPNLPDWICNQDNGECGKTNTKNGKTYFNMTGSWKQVSGSTHAVPAQTRALAAPPNYQPEPRAVKEEPDWDAITEGKVRHGVVIAMLRQGHTKEQILAEAPFWVEYIMGNHPQVPF